MNTITGIIIGLGLFLLAFIYEGGSPDSIFMIAPLVVVIGGTLMATMAGSTWKQFKNIPTLMSISFNRKAPDHELILEEIIAYSTLARKEGKLVLDDKIDEIKEPFLRKLFRLYADGTDVEAYKSISESEIESITDRHESNIEIFKRMGGFSPTMGIIGTVMGLITTLSSAGDEPNILIQRIAFAFIATLWGIMMANMVWIPISDKLRTLHNEEIKSYELMIDGVYGLFAGDVPSLIQKRLASFYPISEQRHVLMKRFVYKRPKS